MLDHIESDLEFAGRLTQEQRSKLLEIAEKCPVHRTLVSEIDIRKNLCLDDGSRRIVTSVLPTTQEFGHRGLTCFHIISENPET